MVHHVPEQPLRPAELPELPLRAARAGTLFP
jgi:hypothetical protein